MGIFKYALLLLSLSPSLAQANWTLPEDAQNDSGAFANCTFSAGVVTCPQNVNLNQGNRTLTITQPLTLRMQQGLSMPSGLTVNPGNTRPFTLEASGQLSNNGNNLTFNGDIISTSQVNISGSGSQVNGSISSTADVNLNGSGVLGPVNGNNVTFNNGGLVEGSVNANGRINLNDGNIGGAATAGDDININNGSTIDGNVSSGSSIALNNGSIGGNADASQNLSINNGSSVGGSASAGSTIALNNGSVGGSARANEININNSSSIAGDAQVDNQITINSGNVGGNIDSGDRVTIENNGRAGSVNADGQVINRGIVDGYINAPPPIQGNGSVGETCDINNNNGPCSGGPTPPGDGDASTVALAWCEDIWQQGSNQNNFYPEDIPLPEEALNNPLPQELEPGDYLRRGDFDNVGENYQTNGPTTRIFVDGDLTIQSGRRLNLDGDPEDFMLIVTGSLTLEGDVSINGYVHAEDVTFAALECETAFWFGCWEWQPPTTITGAVNASEGITVQGSNATRNNPSLSYVTPSRDLEGGRFCLAQPYTELQARFNDGPWSNATVDTSDNDFTVEAINNPGYSEASPALPTDGSGFGSCGYTQLESNNQQHFNVADAERLDFSGSFTVGAWVRPESRASGLMTIVSKDENYEFHINSNGRVNWWWQTRSGQVRQFNSDTVVPLNQWTYVAIRYTPTEQSIFVGNSKTTEDFSGGIRQNSDPLQIGADQNTAGRYFDGSIDDVSVIRGALSDTEIEALSQQRVPCDDVQLQCVVDEFADGTALSNRWQVRPTEERNGVRPPRVVDETMRLTDAIANQSTLVSLRRVFPAANNRVEIEFDLNAYGGTGADGIAVVLSNANFVPEPGGYGGSLGYAQRSGIDGFNGGWLGIGFDTFGNFVNSNEGRQGGRNLSLNQGRNRVSLRGAEQTGYQFIQTSEQLSPGIRQNSSTRGPGHRYRIVIDSTTPDSSFITVERDLKDGNGFRTIIDELDIYEELPGQQPVVPENFRLSFTGSTGGSNDIHEVDFLRVCAQRSFPLGNEVNHLRLTLPTELVSCYAADMLLEACLDDNCDTRLSGPGSARLQAADDNTSATPEWAGPDLIGSDAQGNADIDLTDGTGSVQLSLVEGGVVDFTKISSSPATLSADDFRCYSGSTRVNCTTNFQTAGLAFFDADGTSPIQNQISGTSFPAILRALQTNTMTGACEARVEGTQTVELGYECTNPGSCIAGQRYEFNDTPVENSGSGVVSESVELDFDANGSADLINFYSDAGELRLHARADLPATPRNGVIDPPITLTGVSNNFVVKPERLVIDAPANTDVNEGGSGFVAAGDAFRLRVRALNAQGNSTPNFGNETIPAQVNATFNSIVYPAGGFGDEEDLNTSGFTKPDPQQGVFITDNASWEEAGIIELRAELVDGNYLGAGDIPLTPVSEPIGRFYPSEFVLEGSDVVDACRDQFTYLGEDAIGVTYTLHAVNTNGKITRNYDADGFTGSEYQGTAEIAIGSGSTEIEDSRVIAPTAQDWSEGVLAFDGDDVMVARAISGTATRGEGPYRNTQLALRINEALDPTDFKEDETILDGQLNLRFGRLVLADVAGPDDEDLPIKARVEYWDGDRFIVNEEDSCFYLQSGKVNDVQGLDGFQPPDVGPDNSELVMFEDGRTGFRTLYFQAPGDPGELEFSYQVPDWLTYDWNENGVFDQQPRAFATFGQYRGNDRIIFWLEQNLQ